MVAKEGKPIFFQILSIASIVIILNLAFLIYKSGGLSNGITGFSIKTNITDSFKSLSGFFQVFIIIEISFVCLILLMAFIRDKNIKKTRKKTIELHIQKNTDKNKTDLDTLFDALKEKKELNISAIETAFGVDKDTVLEWGKILESAELASIEYPGFSEPVIKLNEKEVKVLEIKKTDILKDSDRIKKEISLEHVKEHFSNKEHLHDKKQHKKNLLKKKPRIKQQRKK